MRLSSIAPSNKELDDLLYEIFSYPFSSSEDNVLDPNYDPDAAIIELGRACSKILNNPKNYKK